MLDPLGILSSLTKVNESWMRSSLDCSEMLTKLNRDMQHTISEELDRLRREDDASAKIPTDPKDALLDSVRKHSRVTSKFYLTYSKWLKEYVHNAPGLEGKEKQRAIFWTNQIINALAPSNCFWTNPAAVDKYIKSNGESLAKGRQNWLDDVNRGDNLVKIADTEAFKVGENLATTPGFVVYRNALLELIQYTPTTQTTYAVPVVFIQPWINRFYIFDLDAEKSLVRYMLDQGFTVFIVSWKNPTSEMRDTTFEDYMFSGVLQAVEVAKDICSVQQVHAVGYCIGGTTLAALAAWLNREPAQNSLTPIRHLTLLATMVDFAEPGELGVYICEKTVEAIERLLERDGYLDARYMALAFRLLRSDSLIWRYHAHNYLQGGAPPKSDMLFWNTDSTRLPAAMCSFYLREFYLHNNLVKEDGVVLGNRPINLRLIEQPIYVVGAEQDHICPWRETFRICNLVRGPVRYVLTTEGHIAGIVNPPSERGRKKYWAAEVDGQIRPDEWLSDRPEQKGSWWTDWAKWLSERCDGMAAPPPIGSPRHPPMEKAPGRYVMEQ